MNKTLTYEFDLLEEILESLLTGKALTEADNDTVATECRRIKKTFIRCIPGVHRELLEGHFRLHDKLVRGWCEEVYGLGKKVQVMSGGKPDLTLGPVLKIVEHLDDLLLFMETHLSDYLPKPEHLTRYRLDKELDGLKALVAEVDGICATKDLSPALRAAIRNSLTLEGAVPEQVLPEQIAYCKRLAQRIGGVLQGMGPGEDAGETLLRLLWKRNLNSAAFYYYCLGRAKAGNNTDLPLHEQQAYYIALQNEVATVYREPDEAFNSKALHITDQLYRAYAEELTKLRRLEKINLRLEYRADPEDIFRTSLSARQLALFVRLLINTGLILVDRPQRLFDFVCRHFRSVGTDKLSPESFYKNAHKKLARDVERLEEVVADLGKAVEELSS